MRRFIIFGIVAFLAWSCHYSATAQISIGGTPPSFTEKVALPELQAREFPAPDLNVIQQDDLLRSKNGVFHRVGISVPVNLDLRTAGTWTPCGDQGRVCRLKIKSAGALALGVYYSDFYIPKGCRLYLYNADHSQVIGGYTSSNNPSSGVFATELIRGDEVTLEYYEPYRRLADEPRIILSEVSYVYRDAGATFGTKDFGDSESCEVNINCSEGSSYQNQKRGVARIFLKAGTSYGWCTGTLINNVNNDCTPYFLTADHCGNESSTADLNQWVFYFNYEASGCTDPTTEPSSNTMTGCTKKASGGNGGDSGSDFFLVLFNSSVPSGYNPYYNGWSRSTTAASSGVSIHHPAGDIKKISTFTSTLVSSQWGTATGSHWRVTWASTTNGTGVTEGGSSGSPLFNSSGLVIGDLTGGGSYCTATTQPDYYGKFSYSWESNGTTAATRLKDWLDPASTNPTTLAGCGPCSSSAPVANFSANTTTIAVGGSVNFTDLSTNTPTSWSWTFTGGTPSSSTLQNPQNIVYNAAGTYTVSLTATNAYGSDTETKTAYITVTSGGTATCDTLGLPLSGSPSLYQASGGGYATGNNSYGDKAKAQYYGTYSPYTQLNGILFWFGAAEGGSGNAQAAAWNQVTSAPGTTFATANVAVSTIMSDVTNNYYTYVAFASPATIPGPFYAGVILPTTSGDTIGLVSNAAGDATTVNAWEMWSNNSWNNFSTAWSGNLNVDLAIFPHVCQTTTGNEHYTLDPGSVQVFPNPATDKLFITFGNQLLTKVQVEIMNMLGEKVLETLYTDAASNMIQVDVSTLTPGTYFLKLTSGDQIATRSVILAK